MTDWSDLLKFGSNSAILTLIAVGVLISAVMPGVDKWNRRYFVSLFLTLTLCLTVVLIDLLVWKNPDMATVEKVCIFFQYLLIPLPMPMFTTYLLRICGEKWQNSGLFLSVLSTWICLLILLIIAQYTTFMYYVTPDNRFFRGDWNFLLMIAMILPMIFNLVGVIRRRKKLSKKYYAAFIIYLLPLTTTLIIHTFIMVDPLVFFGMVLSTFSMFAIILYDQIDRYMRQQKEIARQRVSIMVLQMRPHFIYNAMMSIYYLCEKNPQKAQQVTLDFTAYLRRNFTAIASENPVPFSDELEHTKAYLAIEQVQFEDNLLVEYDTPHKDFNLPPLTLQPIVENAVKHGMDPEYAPLQISIRTRKTDFGSEIIVEDNGHGFIPNEKKAPHTALSNIREKLDTMCGGKLSIKPKEGGGTVIRVMIP